MLLRTLGEVRIEGAERAEEALSSRRKELAMLAFLARRGPRGCTRDELSSLLWEDRDRSRARQSLRHALLELKRTLGDALVMTGEQVTVDHSKLQVDVRDLERDLEAGRFAKGVEGDGRVSFCQAWRMWEERLRPVHPHPLRQPPRTTAVYWIAGATALLVPIADAVRYRRRNGWTKTSRNR